MSDGDGNWGAVYAEIRNAADSVRRDLAQRIREVADDVDGLQAGVHERRARIETVETRVAKIERRAQELRAAMDAVDDRLKLTEQTVSEARQYIPVARQANALWIVVRATVVTTVSFLSLLLLLRQLGISPI